MKSTGLKSVAGLFAGLALVFSSFADVPRTLEWVGGGGSDKKFSTAANWQDTTGKTNAVPRSGDTLKITYNTGTAKNDIAGLAPYKLYLAAYQTQDSASLPLVFTTNAETCAGIDNAGYLHYDFPTALVGTNVPMRSTSVMVCRSNFFSYDGRPCGIRKTGSDTMGMNGTQIANNPAAGTPYANFKYIDLAEGTFAFGFNGGGQNHLFPRDMVFTFSAKNTTLMLRDTCAFTNFWMRETGGAVGGVHKIGAQTDGGCKRAAHLKICGTIPEDVTTFSGTIVDCVDFTWAPDAATQSFVFDGGVSTTTGSVAVANGTVRLTNGASFTQLKKLTLSGGASSVFAVDAAPSQNFRAAEVELVTGNERFSLANGVALRFGGLTVNGVRIQPGTYTSANATWITGGGSVMVEGLSAFTYTWAKKASYANLKWSTANNWVDQNGNNGVPQNGDTIYLPGRSAYDAGGTAGRTDGNVNDLTGFRPRRIYVQGGYSSPSGNPVIFDGTDSTDGIYNSGYMFFRVPIHVNTDAITICANSDFGYRADLCSTDGHRFRVKKTGNYKFGFGAEATARDYTGLSAIEIHAGTLSFGWQGNGNADAYPEGLQVQYMAANTAINVSMNTTLRGAVISEAAAVVGKAHTIARESESKKDITLTLTGVPAEQEQTFTGTLQAGLDFTWAPEASDRVFTFSGSASVNPSTNTVSVTNGTLRLADGATFTKLGTLRLSGGAGACFRVDAAPVQPFHATNLVLETGLEKVLVAGGVKIACDTLTVNGETLPAGVYVNALCPGGTGVSWMAGGGFLCVGGADVTIPVEPAGTTTASWTANGGADTSIGNASNWGTAGSGTLPDLDTGTLEATFAAGTGASLDRSARFRKLTLDAPGTFAFAASDSSLFATLGSGGLATSGAGRSYTFGWPLYLLGDQTWTVPSGDTLNLAALLGGVSSRIVFPGGGTVNMNRTIGYGGSLVFSNGVVNANADDCFGANATVPVDVHMYTAKLYLNGVTLNRTVRNITADVVNDKVEGSKRGYVYVTAGTTNVICGDLDCEAYTDMQLNLGANSQLRVKGHFRRGRSYWCMFSADDNNGADVFFEKKVKVLAGAAVSTVGQVRYHFLAADNDFGSNWLDFGGTRAQIHTCVPYAFTTNGNHRLRANANAAGRIWDLHGNDQGLTEFWSGSGLTVRSDEPALLHLKVTNAAYVHTNACVFAGAAGLSFEGTKSTGLSSVNTSTGVVQAVSGQIDFTANARWQAASRVVLKGGAVSCADRGTFGRTTDLDYTSGTLKLNYAGTMRLHNLFVNGAKMPDGVYGAADNMSVPAENRLSWITGTGRIGVYGDGAPGLVFLLR